MSGQSPVNPFPRVTVWAAGAKARLRRHPLAVDTALVVLIALIALPRRGSQEREDQAGWTWLLFAVPLIVPLVWRRKAPTVVFTFVSAVALVQWASHQLSTADLALLVAFYTVAAYEPWRRILAAAAVLEVGAILAAARFAPP